MFPLLFGILPTLTLYIQRHIFDSLLLLRQHQTIRTNHWLQLLDQILLHEISDLIVVGEELNVLCAGGPHVGLVERQGLRQYAEEALRVVDVGEAAGALFDVYAP